MRGGKAIYLDSSAILKLVISEQESSALQFFLTRWPIQTSSSLARVEVVRAAQRRGTHLVAKARGALQRLDLIQLHDALLDDAAYLEPYTLRTLDAIHLAAARTLGSSLSTVVTYDLRMIAAAKTLGMDVAAPGSNLA